MNPELQTVFLLSVQTVISVVLVLSLIVCQAKNFIAFLTMILFVIYTQLVNKELHNVFLQQVVLLHLAVLLLEVLLQVAEAVLVLPVHLAQGAHLLPQVVHPLLAVLLLHLALQVLLHPVAHLQAQVVHHLLLHPALVALLNAQVEHSVPLG